MNLSALQSDYDNLNARLEEETETSSTLRTSLSKVTAEYSALKMRFDKEIAARTEELEETRSVLLSCLCCGVSVWLPAPDCLVCFVDAFVSDCVSDLSFV